VELHLVADRVGDNSREGLAGRLHRDWTGFSGVFFIYSELRVDDETVYF